MRDAPPFPSPTTAASDTSAGPASPADVRVGLIAGTIAYTLWGFFPVYFILLGDVASDEVLANRILWAVPVGILIISFRKQWRDVLGGLVAPRVLGLLCLSAVFIAVNWLLYIYAVQNGRILEASLGYYINPLMYVLVGVIVLKEQLRRFQRVAVGLAALGVAILTVFGGQFPVIALTLATSFTIYGYIRKRVAIGAMPGLFIETLLLMPLAALYLFYIISTRDTAMETGGPSTFVMLALAGPFTVIPLLCFAIGARRLTLATMGFLQYIGPTLQFLIGIANGEPFDAARIVCFVLIWTAAAIFTWDAWRNRKPAAA